MSGTDETAGLEPAAATVVTFLRTVEARDLAAARRLLGSGFIMHFPASPPMRDLEELVALARTRYRFARKTFEGIEVAPRPAGGRIVWVHGTLHGEWLDGRAFAGIRFVDRFEIDAGGAIVRQDVWNDMAAAAAALR